MKIFEGIVISTKTPKTAVVEVSRRTPHPLYQKLIKRSKKFKADTGENTVSVGSVVRITETRPISKGKYFKITAVLGKTLVKKEEKETEEEKVMEEIKVKKPVKTEKKKIEAAIEIKEESKEKPVRKTAKKITKKGEKEV